MNQMEFKLSLKNNDQFDVEQQKEFNKLLKLARRLEKRKNRSERGTDDPALMSSDSEVEDDDPELNRKMFANPVLKQQFGFIKEEAKKRWKRVSSTSGNSNINLAMDAAGMSNMYAKDAEDHEKGK